MQKWEYRTVTVSRDPGFLGGVGDWDNQVNLARLGEEGWELVSVVPQSDMTGRDSGLTTSVFWVFKRPKP